MQVSDFDFDLPSSLIAHYPQSQRSACRLLSLNGNTGQLGDGVFTDILQKIESGDLLVFNNTRVIPARLFGQKASGGKLEVLVERLLDSHTVLAHVRASKAPKQGAELQFDQDYRAIMVERHDALFQLKFDHDVLTVLEQIGHMPLPPYIDRPDEALDKELYQTVYSQHPGAVAAPTAGLHFDDALLAALKAKGVEMAFVTLHVGAGTFQPVRVDQLEDHIMHAEYVQVSQEVVDAINACKARGKRVIAVGTTSVRSLESAAQASISKVLQPFNGDTNIFIYPGYQFHVVDCLITNFHLPQSTLIMLVSAFAGYQHTMAAYQHAIAKKYQFFSYGDGMFITKNEHIERDEYVIAHRGC